MPDVLLVTHIQREEGEVDVLEECDSLISQLVAKREKGRCTIMMFGVFL